MGGGIDRWVDEEWKYECVFVHIYECIDEGRHEYICMCSFTEINAITKATWGGKGQFHLKYYSTSGQEPGGKN